MRIQTYPPEEPFFDKTIERRCGFKFLILVILLQVFCSDCYCYIEHHVTFRRDNGRMHQRGLTLILDLQY